MARSEGIRQSIIEQLRQIADRCQIKIDEDHIDNIKYIRKQFINIARQQKSFKQSELYSINREGKFNFSDLLVESVAIGEEIDNIISYHQTINILVITEDSGYGYLFLKYILRRMYPDYRIILIQTMGNQNFETSKEFIHNKLQELGITKIDIQLFIYDNIDTTQVVSDRQHIYKYFKLRTYLYNIQTVYNEVHPISFKEFMVQVTKLLELTGKAQIDSDYVFQMYKDLINGVRYDIDIVKLQLLQAEGQTAENMLEGYISKLLSKTRYEVNHGNSTIGWCWYKNCKDCDRFKYCNHSVDFIKSSEISRAQLIYLVVSSIDKGLGLKFRLNDTLENLQSIPNNYLSNLMQE